ncbi:hypothetical protein RchiOBHm_Chr6g0269141 [Rosa chinensis]|uniref:Uncharacterized protein n=1 Tax=Rosa chinensis TaxID=74649 RepID=A0A2P6PQF9_ROSCH|nr:hypothetical protein RchiOBHm_Chr6g0269141 [Rosa chinensis]
MCYKGEDSLGNDQKEEVVVSVKKKKKKPGRKSKKGLVGNGDGGLKEVTFGGDEIAMMTLRKRPERNKRVRVMEVEGNGEKGEENGASVNKKGRKKVKFAKEGGAKGVLEVDNDKKRDRKRAKTEEEDGNEVGYSFRPLREQGHLSTEERRKEVPLMCHQCQRNDKGRVVRCKKCRTKEGELPTRFGSATLMILLLQDIAVVPLLVILLVLESQFVAEARSSEAFVALCLLTVAGTSLLTQKLGFSDTVYTQILLGVLPLELNKLLIIVVVLSWH